VVRLINGCLFCTCSHYERHGIPCSHILQVTSKLVPEMCDIRWFKCYAEYFKRNETIMKVLCSAVDNAVPGVRWEESIDPGCNYPIAGAGTTEEEIHEMNIMYNQWGCRVFVCGEPIAVVSDDTVSANAVKEHAQLHQFVCRSDSGVSFPHSMQSGTQQEDHGEDDSLHYNDLKKMFDSIHKLSSNSKAEKIWLRDELQRLLSERIAVTAGKNNRSHSSSHVSCFPAIDRSKKSVNNCK